MRYYAPFIRKNEIPSGQYGLGVAGVMKLNKNLRIWRDILYQHREKHPLYPIEINDVPVDTKDKDEILKSEFFDTRQAFLSLCQGNHYQ
ncbi:hypothetical protein L1987_04919 [Smallanthus sonchifolius]|uniref:Uncharacterized protein n=1 Tax=Smallanthus sonchifolius TaxID=185202 RepID=A0ACB9JTX6_9ASTR|nr:hypothetical protein L1987_04919 [Smallanthus sonchifolius]